MSIDAEEFDKHKNPMKYIVTFLQTNSDRAYTVQAIAKGVGVNVMEVRNAFRWDFFARLLDNTYRSPIEIATVGGVTYYKYKG